ncbi:MAG: UvrD-helicase domain-containing protein [Burkholderiaceae bacterium]
MQEPDELPLSTTASFQQSSLLAGLNPEQLAAVTLPAQPALILAGAGSGKTRVLTTRMAWLIQTHQVSPANVLAVTFTNKAAKEMLARLATMLPINLRGMWIGTFHGLCNRFLRTHYRDAALPQTFQILDVADQIAAVKRLQKTFGIDEERYPPRQSAWFINGAKEKGLRAKDVEIDSDFDGKLVEIYRLYDEQCQREGVVDFAELLLRSYELLTRNQPLREHYQARFRHILVDEFQDTNVLQYKWLKLLAGLGTPDRAAIFAVGDDDQSIYAFRGANVGNMAEFEREFRVQNVIKLEQNYRSHGHILDAANALIKNNGARLGKNLWTDAGVGEPVRVYEATGDAQEAQWLVDEVKALVREGLMRSNIAVLYRSNAQSRVIEHALFSAGIPYRVYGGLRFFERQEVKHALAYLRLIANPDDDTSFARIVNVPARGIGARSIEVLQDAAKNANSSLYAAASALADGTSARASVAAAAKLGIFVKLIERLRFETQAMPLSEMIEHVNHASGLIVFYESEKDSAERVENLNEVVNAAASFAGEEGFALNARANRIPVPASASIQPPRSELQTPGAVDVGDAEDLAATEVLDAGTPEPAFASPLDAFLSHASLEAGDNQASAGQDALQLMTVHSAKGLEFDAVFIGGLEEGLFPHDNSTTDQAGLEEERRLMYVAITRARRRLYLSFSQTRMLHGQTRYNPKSRFFNELPDETLKWLTPRMGLARQGFGGGFGSNANTYGRHSAAWDDAPTTSEALPAWTANKRGGDARFRIGQSVVHAKFGEGVIVNLEGSGNDARAQINFGRQGMKWLALGIAKLEAA